MYHQKNFEARIVFPSKVIDKNFDCNLIKLLYATTSGFCVSLQARDKVDPHFSCLFP